MRAHLFDDLDLVQPVDVDPVDVRGVLMLERVVDA